MFRAFATIFTILYLLLLSITSSADVTENKSACPAGDAYFLQYLGLKDEVMRIEDYKNFYEPLKRLSQAGFCIHLNWSASIRDLKQALTNKRPTIIIWSSHGQPGGITNKDDDQFLLPPDIFKNISPSVYQFVVATCFGSLAIKNYDLQPAKQVKFTGWDFPLSTEYFRKFLEKWNFLENYPTNYVHNGLSCQKTESQYQLISVPGGKVISSFPIRKVASTTGVALPGAWSVR